MPHNLSVTIAVEHRASEIIGTLTPTIDWALESGVMTEEQVAAMLADEILASMSFRLV